MELNPFYEKIISNLLEQQFSVVDDFFTTEEVLELRQNLLLKYEDDLFKKSAIGNIFNEQVMKSVRGDFIYWLDERKAEPAEQRFFEKINAFVEYLNRTCFLGILEKEFHYALYPVGTFYKRHLDTFQNDDRRKLSIVCYLNEEDWQPEYGGALAIYQSMDGAEHTQTIYPLQGRMVVFESQILEHEVLPVARERLSITGWLKTR